LELPNTFNNMVAGLPRKSRNGSNHFLPTRPTKEEVNQRNQHNFHEQSAKPSLLLRPKNGPEGTIVTVSKTIRSEEKRKNGTKRSTNMPVQKAPFIPDEGAVSMNEAKRRYVLRSQIGYTSTASGATMFSLEFQDHHDPSLDDEQVVSGILDGITSLCLGPTTHASGYQTGVSTPSYNASPRSTQRRKKKVVYPIVSYPARLNCQKLVSQRRAVFHQNLFRPVSSDESSLYQSVRA
jgi:hypothetical protein